MPEKPDINQIKKDLDMKRAKIKENFERKIQKLKGNAEQHREKISAYKKKRDSDIAEIEESYGKAAAAAFRKQLGDKDFERMQKWLLEKRTQELKKLEREMGVPENENYDMTPRVQGAKTDPPQLIYVYYIDKRDRLMDEMQRDIGIAP